MHKEILFIEWKSFGNEHIKKAFNQLGYSVENYLLDTKKVDTRLDMEYTERLVQKIVTQPYFFVFSFNYYPIVAIACKACRIPYVSWTYDSPFIQLYSETLKYDTNFAFVFDRGTCYDLEQKGLKTYYLPMAAPIDCYKEVLQNNRQAAKYAGDISFVGSLYNEPHHNMFRHLEKMEEYEKGYVDALLFAQKNIYGYNFLEKVLRENPAVFKRLQEVCPVYARGDGLESAEWTLANYFLARKITAQERMEVLTMLGKEFSINLYTATNPEINGVRYCQTADYHTQAPLIFANSKINLNITLRSIQTGIPLRAFDIMGCGGFLLTNYQEDFLEYFEPDEDFVMYSSYEELMDKVRFYMKQETQRIKIAQNGFQKVSAEHTYLQRVESMLALVEGYWE